MQTTTTSKNNSSRILLYLLTSSAIFVSTNVTVKGELTNQIRGNVIHNLESKDQPLFEVPHLEIYASKHQSISKTRHVRRRNLNRMETDSNTSSENRQIERSASVQIQPKIVGGDSAATNSFPSVAALIKQHRYFHCGATLIASNVVLTAAHCVGNVHGVLIGRYDLNQYGENEEYFVIQEKLIHPNYANENAPVYDFALLKIYGASKHEPARLDDGSLTDSLAEKGKEAAILGWGMLEYNSSVQTMNLQEGRIDLMSNAHCKSHFWGDYIEESMICAYREGVSGCGGDSGGPLFYQQEDSNDENEDTSIPTTLLGVMSWGSGYCDYATVFAKISDQYKWVIGQTNDWTKGEVCYNYMSTETCNTDSNCTWSENSSECISSSMS